MVVRAGMVCDHREECGRVKEFDGGRLRPVQPHRGLGPTTAPDDGVRAYLTTLLATEARVARDAVRSYGKGPLSPEAVAHVKQVEAAQAWLQAR